MRKHTDRSKATASTDDLDVRVFSYFRLLMRSLWEKIGMSVIAWNSRLHDCTWKGGRETWLVERRHGSLRTSFRNGDSMPRYLLTTYKQKRWRSMPAPVMASRYIVWWNSAALLRRAILSFFYKQNTVKTYRLNKKLTCFGFVKVRTVFVLSSIARTKAEDGTVHERTVSVRPSRNNRVIEASYVRQNFPASWNEVTVYQHSRFDAIGVCGGVGGCSRVVTR